MKPVKRTDNRHLPDRDELAHILAVEEFRAVPPSKTDIHYPDFATFLAILNFYRIESDIFSDNSLTIHDAVVQGASLLSNLVAAVLADQSPTELLNAAYDYLAEQDEPHKSDLIFVFGGKTPLRAERAAELFHDGIAPRIMVSGGNPIYGQDNADTEAGRYRQILLDNGVPEQSIIVENRSITIPDNVRSSLNLLEQQGTKFDSITLVNSPYTQRRGWALMMKYLPDQTTVYRVNSATADQYQPENWYKQESTLRIVLNEFIKLRAAVVNNNA